MKLVKKSNCGVVIGEIARGVLVVTILGSFALSLNISCHTKKVKPHVKLEDVNGQIVYCLNKDNEIFVKTIAYDVHDNCIVISDYLTGTILATITEASAKLYKKNNNLENLSDEEFKKEYLSALLRKECIEIQPISSLLGDADETTETKLKGIINEVSQNPETYIAKNKSKTKK